MLGHPLQGGLAVPLVGSRLHWRVDGRRTFWLAVSGLGLPLAVALLLLLPGGEVLLHCGLLVRGIEVPEVALAPVAALTVVEGKLGPGLSASPNRGMQHHAVPCHWAGRWVEHGSTKLAIIQAAANRRPCGRRLSLLHDGL